MKIKRKQLRITAPAKTEKLHGHPNPKGLLQLANVKTGRLIRMSAKSTTLLCNKYPREFKIL